MTVASHLYKSRTPASLDVCVVLFWVDPLECREDLHLILGLFMCVYSLPRLQ